MEELLTLNYNEYEVEMFSSKEIVDGADIASIFSCYMLCPIG